MTKKLLVLGMFLAMCVTIACGKNSVYEVDKKEEVIKADGMPYETFLTQIGEDKRVAYVELMQQFILVSDETYLDQGGYVAMGAEVYLLQDEHVTLLNTLQSGGTAYPISADEEGFYVAGGHFCAYYQMKEGQLVMSEYVNESFDTKGNASYRVFKDEKESEGSKVDFETIFERYGKAERIYFETV